MKHLLSIADLGRDGIEDLLRLTDSFVEVSERVDPEGACAPGPHGRLPLLRGLDAHSTFVRDGREATLGRHDVVQRRLVVGQQGRVAARHRRDDRGHGRRRRRRPAQVVGRAVADREVDRRVGGQRRRRLARAPDAGAARLLHDPRRARPADLGSARGHRRRHQALAASPGRTCSPSTPSAPGSRSSGRARCCRRASKAGASTSRAISTTCCRSATSCTSCGCSSSARPRRWSRHCASTARGSVSTAAGSRGCRSTRWSCTQAR